MGNLVWRLQQTDEGVKYQVYGSKHSKSNDADVNPDMLPLELNEPTSPSQKAFGNISLSDRNDDLNNERHIGNRRLKRKATNGIDISNALPISCRSKPDCNTKISKKDPKVARLAMNKDKSKKRVKGIKAQPTDICMKSDQFNLFCISSDDSACVNEIIRQKNIDNVTNDMKISEEDSMHASILKNYFQLEVDLEKLYHEWSASDPYFSTVAVSFEGIRILRQDPTENLLSFVCSSNNHISRITSMVEKLCCHYGKLIAEVCKNFSDKKCFINYQ